MRIFVWIRLDDVFLSNVDKKWKLLGLDLLPDLISKLDFRELAGNKKLRLGCAVASGSSTTKKEKRSSDQFSAMSDFESVVGCHLGA